MEEKIIDIICQYQGIEKDKISIKSDLIKDIGLSSFDITELICKIEDEFGIEIPNRQISSFQTVNDVIEYLNLKLK